MASSEDPPPDEGAVGTAPAGIAPTAPAGTAANAPAAPPPESAAVYLAKCLIADHRYAPAVLPEAAPLAEVADIVLTGGDGVGLAIACIIDRDADPGRRFTMDPARVDQIAAACRRHAGSMYGVRESVTVEIWEVGAGVPDADDRARLERYAFRRVTQKGVGVRAYAVDTAPASVGGLVGELYSTAADRAARQAWLRQVLGGPRRSDHELAAARQAHDKVARFHTAPVATLALLAAFVAMFVLELAWAVMPTDGLSPTVGTLIALGGLEHSRVEAGEYWRLLTCAFLHGDFWHLLFNCVAMYMAGGVLENLVGRRWMLGLFVIGAVGGSLASLALNEAHVTSVGASGAIMGLLAAAMVTSLRLPSGPARHQILISLGQILIPSLLPLAAGGSKVDFGAHLGGAIAGAVVGLLLLVTWAREAERPRLPRLAAVLAAAALAYTGFGWVTLAGDHDEYVRGFAAVTRRQANPELVALLIPDEQLPKDDPGVMAALPGFLAEYPRDPRTQFFAAVAAINRDDLDAARDHLERALAERELRDLIYTDARFEVHVRWLLAQIHEQQGNLPLATAAVAPVCDAGKRAEDPETRAFYERLCVTP